MLLNKKQQNKLWHSYNYQKASLKTCNCLSLEHHLATLTNPLSSTDDLIKSSLGGGGILGGWYFQKAEWELCLPFYLVCIDQPCQVPVWAESIGKEFSSLWAATCFDIMTFKCTWDFTGFLLNLLQKDLKGCGKIY